MVNYDLDKDDLIALCKGKEPGWCAMDHRLIRNNGHYNDLMGGWKWNYDAFEDYSIDELWETHSLLKHIK